MSLVARKLEAEGVSTVVLGSARDIVEEVGVPRFVFTDLPLGNPCGPPHDRDAQLINVTLALRLVESALSPRTTVQANASWPDDAWRQTFMEPDSQIQSQ